MPYGVEQNAIPSTINDPILDLVTGEVLAEVAIRDDRLVLRTEGSSPIVIFDDGQLCCESRYMHTDDPLAYFVGAILQSIDLRWGPEEGIESAFLLVHTSKGTFTVVNYNDHNGYYGGFSIRVSTPEILKREQEY